MRREWALNRALGIESDVIFNWVRLLDEDILSLEQKRPLFGVAR